MEGLAAWKTVPQIAGDIRGADASAVQDWDNDSGMRAQVRWLVKKARFLAKGGCRELAARQRPRL